MTRWSCLILVCIGCGGSGGGDIADGPGPLPRIDAMPSSCDPPKWADGLTPTSERHVGAGQTYATIEDAAQGITPGTAIVVHAGSYAGDMYLANLAGTAAAPIWIGGAVGETRPIISGGAEALHLSSPRYVIIHDLEITGQTANGLNVDDSGDYANPDAARWLHFRGLYIHDLGSGGNEDCLKLSGLNDYVIDHNEFAACGGGGAGSLIDHVGCHQGLIEYNLFRETTGTGVQCKGGSADIEIRANRFAGAGVRAVNMGGSTGLEFFRPPLSMTTPNAEARDIRVVANVFTGSDAPFAFVGCVDCLAANNTVVDPQHNLMRILQETTTQAGFEFLPASNGRVVNNIFYYDASTLNEDVNIGANTDPTSFAFTTNQWYAHDDPTQSAPVLPVTETGGLVGQHPVLDGQFVPTVWATGTPVPGLAGDFIGVCWRNPPAIGAYERP